MDKAADLSESVHDSRWDAEFRPNAFIVNRTINTQLSGRRILQQEIWDRQKQLGHGGFEFGLHLGLVSGEGLELAGRARITGDQGVGGETHFATERRFEFTGVVGSTRNELQDFEME